MIEYIRFAIFFASGIYLSERISTDFAVMFFISLIFVLTITAFFKRKFNVKILIMSFAFIFGIILCSYAQNTDHSPLSRYEGRYVTVTGRVSELPLTSSNGNIRYVIDAREIHFKDETKKINARLLVTSPSDYSYGSSVTAAGFINKLPIKMNESGFDYAKYYKSKGIFFKMYSSSVMNAPHKIRSFSPYSLGLYTKCFISDIIDTKYNGDYAAILKAVLTGNKREFSDEFNAVLERTGLKRFYYPAFLHIMLFLSVITAVLSFFDRRKREWAVVFLLIIYALFIISTIVAVKLAIMLSLFILIKKRHGHVYYLDVVGMTGIIMGIINPLVYYDAGFALSMVSSILIYYFYEQAEKLVRFIHIKYIRRLTAIGIICNIGLMPVAAYFFNGVSLHSIIVSFIMLPCVTVILVLSPLLISMLTLFHTAPVVSQLVSSMLFLLKYVPILADRWDMSYALTKPDIIVLLIYILSVTAAVKHIKNKKTHRNIAVFCAAALLTSVFINELTRLNDLDIIFVNVGQGDGAVIQAPYRFNILIDGGGGSAYSDYNPGETLFLEYLADKGITVVDSAFVSHYHQDHAEGIVAAMENIIVRNLFMPDTMEGSEWRTKLETAARENGTAIHYINKEELLTYSNGMTIQIIPPAKKTEISFDENDTTCIYYVTYGDFSAMFTGDMTSFAERNLLKGGKVPEADLLKVAHHGSKTSTSKEWVDTLDPLYSVISVGENNTYNLPNKETLDTLENTILYRTDYDGDITFNINGGGKVKRINIFDRRK